jgi:hypothetical protein
MTAYLYDKLFQKKIPSDHTMQLHRPDLKKCGRMITPYTMFEQGHLPDYEDRCYFTVGEGLTVLETQNEILDFLAKLLLQRSARCSTVCPDSPVDP